MKIRINGGKPLVGNITVSGSKNAALPILFSLIAINGISTIRGVPDIGDVKVALALLEKMGAKVTLIGDICRVDTRELVYRTPPSELSSGIRASSYLIGASLARFGKASLVEVGGCSFADRPIDLHLYAAETLGAKLSDGVLIAPVLHPANIVFAKPSVGATVNSLIMAAGIDGETRIYGYAREPHVLAVADFLSKAGASFSFAEDCITVRGARLCGVDYTLIGDMIEAGSYLFAAVATGGDVSVSGCDSSDLTAVIDFLRALGAEVIPSRGRVRALGGASYRKTVLTASPYPGFPTDLQPLASALISILSGGTVIDEVFPTRFGYLSELSKFGIISRRFVGGAELLLSKPHAAAANAIDLRAGMAEIIVALFAKGESVIDSAENILRGYSTPIAKLLSLGADAELIE